MKGNLEMKASFGEIYLEPSFGHFFLYRVKTDDKAIVVDKWLFNAGTSGLDISSIMQKNISSTLFGSESRVWELFRDFGGLELHHTKLPKFTQVEQRIINSNEFDIVARYGEHYWIAEVKSGNITVADVNRFVEKLKKKNIQLIVLL